jgi:hypothetical protein
MRRASIGKSIALTERDLSIFGALSRYRYLRSTYLHAFAGGLSETRFKERLGDLFHEGYLDRPEQQWQFAQARYSPAVYEIGKRAQAALNECAASSCGPRKYLGATAHRQFAHSVAICECLASIELATLALPAVRFIPWSEILARAPADTQASPMPLRLATSGGIIPDGLFGLEYQDEGKKVYRFFALEYDRGTMPIARSNPTQTSYLAKLATYAQFLASGGPRACLGIPNLIVLTIMTDEARMQETMRRLGEGLPAPQFLFKAIDERSLVAPAPELLVGPWQRASLAALDIGRP